MYWWGNIVNTQPPSTLSLLKRFLLLISPKQPPTLHLFTPRQYILPRKDIFIVYPSLIGKLCLYKAALYRQQATHKQVCDCLQSWCEQKNLYIDSFLGGPCHCWKEAFAGEESPQVFTPKSHGQTDDWTNRIVTICSFCSMCMWLKIAGMDRAEWYMTARWCSPTNAHIMHYFFSLGVKTLLSHRCKQTQMDESRSRSYSSFFSTCFFKLRMCSHFMMCVWIGKFTWWQIL